VTFINLRQNSQKKKINVEGDTNDNCKQKHVKWWAEPVTVQLPTSAVNMALLAFAAAAPCCNPVLMRSWPCSNQSISLTRRAHSSKPTTRWCSRGMGQTKVRTDRRTDTVPLYRPCSAYYVGSVDNWNKKNRRYNLWAASAVGTATRNVRNSFPPNAPPCSVGISITVDIIALKLS